MTKSDLKSCFWEILFLITYLDFIKHVPRINPKKISLINKIWIFYHEILKNINFYLNYFKIQNQEWNWVATFKRYAKVLSMPSRLLLNFKSYLWALWAKLSKNRLLNHQLNRKTNVKIRMYASKWVRVYSVHDFEPGTPLSGSVS